MSWAPQDLLSDSDLVAYERTILTQFGTVDWKSRRSKAIEDWLFPLLASAGLDPQRLRTRYQPASVLGSTSSAFTDYTSTAQSTTTDDIPLASILAASSDALYIGAPWQFRGLSIRMLDAVSSVASTLTVELWCDAWKDVAKEDSTQATSGKPFSKGGAITWTLPEDWVVRAVNSSAALYWARIRLSTAPTSAAIGQVSAIRRSSMCAPVTLRTLALIFREAPIQQDGPWMEKAEQYAKDAEDAWQRIQPLLGREFDTETVDDTIDAEEATQTTEQASAGGGWSLERA
jgi:hypothetical protein